MANTLTQQANAILQTGGAAMRHKAAQCWLCGNSAKGQVTYSRKFSLWLCNSAAKCAGFKHGRLLWPTAANGGNGQATGNGPVIGTVAHGKLPRRRGSKGGVHVHKGKRHLHRQPSWRLKAGKPLPVSTYKGSGPFKPIPAASYTPPISAYTMARPMHGHKVAPNTMPMLVGITPPPSWRLWVK